MIHGGVGYIKNGAIYVPYELLRPLSVVNNSRLFGIYYPTKAENEDKKKHDFVFSPIPYRYWPRIGRYIIRIKHESNAIRNISSFLAEQNISILISDAIRSGHRFDTWNLTLAFEGDEDIDDNLHSYELFKEKNAKRMHEVKKLIGEQFKDDLFVDENQVMHSVLEIPHTGLPYFFEEIIKKRNDSIKNKWIYEPFIVEYSAMEGVLNSENVDRFSSVIIQVLNPDFENKSEWVVFLSTDVRDMTMRAAVILETHENHLIEANYSYRRIGEPDSCKGLLAYVLKHFPDGYRIWKMTNQTRMSKGYSEKGSSSFILEDCSEDRTDGFVGNAQKIFEDIRSKKMPTDLRNVFIDSVEVRPFSKTRIISRIKKEEIKKDRYDVFLSYSSMDSDVAEKIEKKFKDQGIRCYNAKKELRGGDNFPDEIRVALIDSYEICIVFSKNAKNSEWVNTEWGAAWVLNKKIVPILYRISPDELPERLRLLQCKDMDQLDDYVNELINRQERHYK